MFCNAHTEIFGVCESWNDFFGRLKNYGNKKHPLVFFDNAGERNDKDDFYAALNIFMESDSKKTVVLLGGPWEAPPITCRDVEISNFSMPQLADVCSLADETAAKLYCLTGTIPALLSLYNKELPFEDNVRTFLRTDSIFYRLAASWMTECFRTPESYNTLLYAMANGYNRIGEIAKFSGFPKNKCDKYIKALIEHGLVIKAPGENGHTIYSGIAQCQSRHLRHYSLLRNRAGELSERRKKLDLWYNNINSKNKGGESPACMGCTGQLRRKNNAESVC